MNLELWNELLFNRVIEDAEPSRGLYLYADKGVVASGSGLEEDAALKDFSEAFLGVSAGSVKPFENHLRKALAWKRQGGLATPPFVAALAMTVLAVTEDPVGSSDSVYRTQNQLLGLPALAEAPAGYRDHVPALWQMWNAWLAGPGARYGRTTATPMGSFTYQGWARSQGLIRYRDRELVEEFFDSIRANTATQDTDRVTSQFLEWLVYRGEAGQRLLLRVNDPAARDILKDVIRDEFSAWDGTRKRVRAGSSTAHALLLFDAVDQRLLLALPVDEGLRGRRLTIGNGQSTVPDDFDEYVRVEPGLSSEDLLMKGAAPSLGPDLRARVTPAQAYVLREEPSLRGWLQVKGASSAHTYRLLIADRALPRVTEALHVAGLDSNAVASPFADWSWIKDVPATEGSEALNALGLGSLAILHERQVALTGGLRVAPLTYLAGGEPDLHVPTDATASLGALQWSGGGAGRIVSLRAESLLPGRHVISRSDGPDLQFKIVTHIREAMTSGTVAWRLASETNPSITSSPTAGKALSGAHMEGAAGVHPLTLMFRPNHEALVLTTEGTVIEVRRDTDSWVLGLGIDPHTVDVLRAARGTPDRARFFLIRNPRKGGISALSIPDEARLPPGHGAQRLRPDLGAHLIGAWSWVGEPDDKGRSLTLNRLLTSSDSKSPSNPIPTNWPSDSAPVAARKDIVPGHIPGNPYDEILAWISERESGKVSLETFGRTWDWLCAANQLAPLAGRSHRAADRLSRLGHIEIDWGRRSISAAQACLISLPTASGLKLLTGARTSRLLERLEDEDDPAPDVSEATQWLTVHVRSQLDPVGLPAGPSTVYVESDPAHATVVEAALGTLGVRVVGNTAATLLAELPDLDEHLARGLTWEISPSNEFETRSPYVGARPWRPGLDEAWPGLYKYLLAKGDVFGWRDRPSVPATKVDLHTGIWLDERRLGRTGHLLHHPATRQLLVNKSVRLPLLIERALILTTGLSPVPVRLKRWQGSTDETRVAYSNVDAHMATRVAVLLGQELSDCTDTIEATE